MTHLKNPLSETEKEVYEQEIMRLREELFIAIEKIEQLEAENNQLKTNIAEWLDNNEL